MKGKGKKNRDSSDEESVQHCPLMFIDFKPLDHSRVCPRYSSVLNRSEEEGIGLEDLDALQLELETLLVSVVKRQAQLESEMESLANWQDKPKDKKSAISEISGKRSKITEERPAKKIRESPTYISPTSSSSSSSSSSKSHSVKPKSKNLKVQEYDSPAVPAHVPVVRNDVPDKFWSFVKGYCAPVTQENVQVLEDMLKAYEDESEYFKVPNLGKHYTLKWAQEDRWDKKDDPKNSSNDKKKGLSPSNNVSPNDSRKSAKNNKNKDIKVDTDKCTFGALTQRLVSCLIEENLMSSQSLGSEGDFDLDLAGKNGNGDKSQLFKNVNFGNTAQLEKRIKKELEEHGLLDSDDFITNDIQLNNEDEVLEELTRCQNELKAVQAENQGQLKRLLSITKREISMQELNKKLENADNEVIEAYRRILNAKQKKRLPTKKEKDLATKALKERLSILKQMESSEDG
ncbi:transcriptional adapter 3-like protein [Leptotrombidium deliense]|uniref:Transcriptional adapter 3-like protein n=1 Tax=Leptotrombidium deliense TaxID=299467 RepID=A0A443SRR6_9ACAR|nr:transcriptional adapter 3-like protein [Leptotrombidium deliense]